MELGLKSRGIIGFAIIIFFSIFVFGLVAGVTDGDRAGADL